MTEYREITWCIEWVSTLDHFTRGEPITEDSWQKKLDGFLREESARYYLNTLLIPDNPHNHLYRIRKVTTIRDTVYSMDVGDLEWSKKKGKGIE